MMMMMMMMMMFHAARCWRLSYLTLQDVHSISRASVQTLSSINLIELINLTASNKDRAAAAAVEIVRQPLNRYLASAACVPRGLRSACVNFSFK